MDHCERTHSFYPAFIRLFGNRKRKRERGNNRKELEINARIVANVQPQKIHSFRSEHGRVYHEWWLLDGLLRMSFWKQSFRAILFLSLHDWSIVLRDWDQVLDWFAETRKFCSLWDPLRWYCHQVLSSFNSRFGGRITIMSRKTTWSLLISDRISLEESQQQAIMLMLLIMIKGRQLYL